MSALVAMFRDNPVLTKELRVRMRGARAYWILTGYLAFLSLILFFQYTYWWNEAVRMGGGYSSGSRIGQQFFHTIAAVQAFLVAFITPAVTSGGITLEREQRTLEMLELTRLPRIHIVAGKLLSAIGFVVLLLVSSLPLTSLCFFLGGVSPEQVIDSYLLLISGSFVAGALGLAWSSVSRTTAAAVIFTYASLLVPLVVGLIFVGTMMSRSAGDDEIACALAVGLYGVPWPDTIGYLSPYFSAWDMRHFFGITTPVWLVPVLTYSLIGLLLAAGATVRLYPFPERRSRVLKWLIIAVFVQQLFFYFGARFFVVSSSAPPGMAAQLAPYPIMTMLFYPLLLLLLCMPIFATGEATKSGQQWDEFTEGSPRRKSRFARPSAFNFRAAASIPFLFALTAVIFGMYWMSFAIVGQPRAVFTGELKIPGVTARARPPLSVITTPNGTVRIGGGPPAAPTAYHPGGFIHLVITVFASVAGFSALFYLFSVAIRNRWLAIFMSYAVMLFIFVAPAVAKGTYSSDPGSGGSFLINLFYLNPLIALSELTNVDGTFWNSMPLALRPMPMWMVTTTVHVLLAVVALLISIPFVAKSNSTRADAV